MIFKNFLAGLLGLSSIATAGAAAPYCADMLSADTLESRYQRLAPIYNSVETGWIFGSDQLDYRYVLSDSEQALLALLVSELEARGTKLAMLIAPPRPVIAGQDVVDATTNRPGQYDMAAQGSAFHQMMDQIAATGAIAPDLLRLVQSDPVVAQDFYFRRDTHWTNIGPAYSARALAALMPDADGAPLDPRMLNALEEVAERGSLSDIVSATCDTTPDPELSPLFDYSPYLTQSAGLLDTDSSEGTDAILLGTSFSDRYKRDQYQAADALSAALNRGVTNRSVSGGGMIGPFETYLLTGGFAEDQPDLIIWEFPYTYQLNETELRRLLGALRADETDSASMSATLNQDLTEIAVPAEMGATPLLGLRMLDGYARDLVVHLTFSDGNRHRLRLRRKKRMEEIAVLDTWWIDLHGFDTSLQSLTIEPGTGSDLSSIELLAAAAPG